MGSKYVLKLKLLIILYCVNAGLYGLTASFTASTYSGCVSLVVNFTDQSTGGPILWEYDFGDGGTSNSQNPTYTYTKPGKYTVKLRVYDGSVYSTYSRTILVKKLPQADFTSSKTEYCPGETVSFTNLTIKGDTTINTSTWDFGDGNLTNSNGNITKSYASAGKYTIKLSVKDNFGCVNTASKSQYITVNPSPVMSFNVNTKHSCTSPQRVDLINNSSGSISYDWDLGDGSTSTSTNPIVYYTAEKTFTIKLSGISSKGCKADYTATVPIKFGKVKAGFTADNLVGCKPFNVKFTSQNLPVNSKFDYSWDFGDNSTSKLENPIKTYMKTGTFKVQLIIAGSGRNCIDTTYKTIVVSDKPTAVLEIGDTVACNGNLSAMFRAKSSKIINYTWFIDGQNIDTKKDSLNYQFSKVGIYNVQVLLMDSFGCQQSFQFPRVVVQNLVAEIGMNENGGCAPYTIRFSQKSEIGINHAIKYEWDDGVGGTYTGPNPKMTITKEGNYELKMKISDGFGCKNEFTLPYSVGHKIKPSFTYNKKSICNLEPIRFENTTPDSLKKLVNSWYWEMSTASSYDRDYFVATFNQRNARLTPKLVTEYMGCRDTLAYFDSVELKPTWSNLEFFFDTCYSNTVRLVNTTEFATEFEWYLPNGTRPRDTTVYYKMKGDVTETIQLYTKNKLTGCENTVRMKVSPPGAVSNIKATNLSGCTPLPVSFKNFQTNSQLNHWDFGNGDTSNQKDTFVYVYKEPGDYVAKHKGWDYRGCAYTSSTIVHIDGPKAKARVWPTIGCLPLKIQLQDSVNLKKIKKRIWKFQDDPQWIILKKPNELLEYTITSMPANGDSIFNIELMVEDSFGCVTTKVFKLRPIGPKAVTEVKKSEECNADQFLCKAVLDSATAFYPVDITWDMGDGNVFHKTNVNYFYEKGGTYKAKVSVKDGMGCRYENEYTLRAVDPLILAKFSSDTTKINCPPLITKFKNLSLTDPNNPITYFFWDFGDGTTSNLENPSKIYTQTGKYKVSLTVNSIFKCKSTTTIEDYIQVGGPVAAPNIKVNGNCMPVTVQFNSVVNKGTQVEWDFGEGNTKIGQNVKYTYNKLGTYFPKMLLIDTSGCKAVVQPNDTIFVAPSPIADFSFTGNCLNEKTEFKNKSNSNTGNPREYISTWISQTNRDTTEDFSKTFKSKGWHKVSLVVKNKFNCRDTQIKNIRIAKPLAHISLVEKDYCEGQFLELKDSSVSDDGTRSNQLFLNDQPVSSTYPLNGGDHSIANVFIDTFGCTDTFKISKKIHVGDTGLLDRLKVVRTSVVNNRYPELVISDIIDPDFAKYEIYELNANGKTLLRSINDPMTTVSNLQGLSVEKSRCFMVSMTNQCKGVSLPDTHCTINLSIQAQSNTNHLHWNAYTGWDPNGYQIERLNGNTFENIGTVGDTFFDDKTAECHTKHHYRIVALGSTDGKYSYSDTAQAEAIWDNLIPRANLMFATVNKDTSVYLRLNYDQSYNRSKINSIVLYKYNQLGEDQIYTLDTDSLAYLDKRTKVDLERYIYYARLTDDCGDTGSYSNPSGNILLRHVPSPDAGALELRWNAYQKWNSGVAHYNIERKTIDGQFILVGTTSDSVYIDPTAGDQCLKILEYRVRAISFEGDTIYSLSNTIKAQPKSSLFVPNAFTPDNNNINETFAPKGKFIYDYHLEIFNQWGEKIYENTECFGGWNGEYKGEMCQQGVYYYKVSARGTDAQLYNLSGTFQLLN